MSDLKEKISIIMPAYNEAERIASSIEETARAFDDFGYLWELIIFDDGSSDNTFQEAEICALKYPNKVFVRKNPINLGKGRALKKAFRYCSGEYIVFLDADMDLPPVQIRTLFDIMFLDGADIVIGSKMHPNSQVEYPLQRRIISLVYYLLVRVLFDLPCHDTQTGLKLFKAKVLKEVFPRLLVKKFAFDLELLANAHHLGYKIAEAPIILHPRRPFDRIGSHAVIITFWDTLAVFYRLKILKYYDRINYHRRKNVGQEFRRMRR